jgi:hypothetical protein
MNLSYNELFLKILTIIDYKDRENFVKEFEENNRMGAIANCVERLPQEARDQIRANPNQEVIKKYLINDDYSEELNKISATALAKFLQHMTPVLSDSKKEQIAAIFHN